MSTRRARSLPGKMKETGLLVSGCVLNTYLSKFLAMPASSVTGFYELASSAGQYVSAFSYRDRLEGKPVHDEQGTYDRPHFLTCHFDPQKIDSVLKTLGRKP